MCFYLIETSTLHLLEELPQQLLVEVYGAHGWRLRPEVLVAFRRLKTTKSIIKHEINMNNIESKLSRTARFSPKKASFHVILT